MSWTLSTDKEDEKGIKITKKRIMGNKLPREEMVLSELPGSQSEREKERREREGGSVRQKEKRERERERERESNETLNSKDEIRIKELMFIET